MSSLNKQWKAILSQPIITKQEATEFALAVDEVITDEQWQLKQYGRDTVFTPAETHRLKL